MASFFTADGKWNQLAWLQYWTALWAAPTQPGYSTLIREGLARQRALADWLIGQSQIHMWAGLVDEQAGGAKQNLATYSAIAAATDDGAVLYDAVRTPMVTNANSPIFQLGRAMEWLVINSGIPKSTLAEAIATNVTKGMAAVKEVVTVAAGGLGNLLKWVLIGGAAYLVLDAFGGGSE